MASYRVRCLTAYNDLKCDIPRVAFPRDRSYGALGQIRFALHRLDAIDGVLVGRV